MSTFTKPAPPGDGIRWADHLGALLIIEPLTLERNVKTVVGDKDAVSADITVIDGPAAGQSYTAALIFPTLLVSQTQRQIGEKVLGRLGQGNAKPGQNAPWLLQEPTEADEALAEAWLVKSKPIVSATVPF